MYIRSFGLSLQPGTACSIAECKACAYVGSSLISIIGIAVHSPAAARRLYSDLVDTIQQAIRHIVLQSLEWTLHTEFLRRTSDRISVLFPLYIAAEERWRGSIRKQHLRVKPSYTIVLKAPDCVCWLISTGLGVRTLVYVRIMCAGCEINISDDAVRSYNNNNRFSQYVTVL